MKKHLAIICGVFYPDPSPTGLCAKRFAQLLSDEYDIDIICLSIETESKDMVIDAGMRVHTLQGKRMAFELKSNGIVKKMIHLAGVVQIKTSLLGNLTWFRRAANQKLEELHDERVFDAVFTICSPFAAHCAGLDFKKRHPDVRWCGYTVDPYATKNRIRPVGMRLDKLIHEEKKVLAAMDAVLLSEEVHEHRPELYQGCQNCSRLPYMLPMFPKIKNKQKYFDKQYINCVYAGSFYKDIRNPEGMLQYFSKMISSNVRLHLYYRGCEDIVAQYANSSENITLHDRVSSEEISSIYRDADVLINIGNSTPEFLPSKTFEYIVSGKPIVNFYSYRNGEAVLDQHPYCLQLQNKFEANGLKQLQEFLCQQGRKSISKDMIDDIYYSHTPEKILEILMNALRG